jgi:uncharacterized protein DUF6247
MDHGGHAARAAYVAGGPAREPRAIREWLAGDPGRQAEFERVFRAALATAADTFDMEPVESAIGRWWARLVLEASPEILNHTPGSADPDRGENSAGKEYGGARA